MLKFPFRVEPCHPITGMAHVVDADGNTIAPNLSRQYAEALCRWINRVELEG